LASSPRIRRMAVLKICCFVCFTVAVSGGLGGGCVMAFLG
jgi:hypothetical protein